MKRSYFVKSSLALAVAMAVAPAGRGQETAQPRSVSADAVQKATASSETEAQTMTKPAQVRAGSKVQAQLESAVDARTAKPGDQVRARVTKDVKEHGHTVIHKGDRLVGHITQVEAGSSAHEGSRLGIAFDRMISGGNTSALNAVVTSVMTTRNEAQAQEGMFNGPEPMMEPLGAPAGRASASGGGGLLGSAGSTLGSTAGVAGSAVGGVASSAGASAGAAGSTLGNVGGAIQSTTQTSAGSNSSLGLATPARAIHLGSQAQANQQSGVNSVFSTRRGNLRLDSGTQLEFKVAASGGAQDANK